MLDFYRVGDFTPWPDDIPTDSTFLGSIDIEPFHLCLDELAACLDGSSAEPSFFADWTLKSDEVLRLVTCLSRAVDAVEGSTREALGHLRGIMEQVGESHLLAVCD